MAALRCRVQHSPVRGAESGTLGLSMDKLTLEEQCNHEEQSVDRVGGGLGSRNTPSPPVSVIGSPPAVFSDCAPIPVPVPPTTAIASPKPPSAIVWPVVMSMRSVNDGADDDERAGSRDASSFGCDAMLGDAGSCAAAIDEANGDCSRPPGAVGMAAHCSWTGDCSGGCEASATCAGDAAVCHTSQVLCEGVCSAEHQASWCDGPGDGGVPTLGELCPRSCGWCSSPLDFLRLDLVNKSFCVHHEAASCLPADGCTSAAECQRKACALVDITSQPHPVTAAATCEAVPGCFYQRGVNSPAGCVVHPFTMSVQEMAWLLGIMNGETGLSGINADVCLQQGLDGTAVIPITQADFIHFGLTYSQAAGFIAGRDRSTYSIHVLYCLYVRALLR